MKVSIYDLINSLGCPVEAAYAMRTAGGDIFDPEYEPTQNVVDAAVASMYRDLQDLPAVGSEWLLGTVTEEHVSGWRTKLYDQIGVMRVFCALAGLERAKADRDV